MFIHTMFENKVVHHKKSIALVMDDNTLTYEDLNVRANQIAHALIEAGVKPGDIVGLCLERSFEMIAGLMAIMKTGAAYLPLDTEYPAERLRYMITHSKVEKILCHKRFAPLFTAVKSELLILENINLEKYNYFNPVVDISRSVLTYVIYTSGSTGQPKGIAMGAKALMNLIEWQNSQGQLDEDSVTLQYTPISFDVHFQEIFSTLLLGGTLVLVSEQQRLDSLGLLKLIEAKKVNKLFLPYVALNHLCEIGIEFHIVPKSLREITTAGEQLKITRSIRKFFENLNGAILYNHYGPSETHVVTSFQLSGDPHSWPNLPCIGKPIKNVSILILDKDFNEVKKGEEGEIYIKGVCLAEGYLHSDQLTSERFLITEKWGKIYKTGDLGFLNNEENIVFLGRRDSQVKMRGYRIELGEIELAIEKCRYGGKCIVNIVEDGHENYLCAYVNGHESYDLVKLREALRKELPEYMVPSYFIKINKIPLTPSGKVDYKNLPALTKERPELINDFEAAYTPSQIMVENCWKKFLKVSPLGIDDSFFDLGGNSLMAIKILAEINQQVKKKLTIVNFFQFPTIRTLGEYIDHKNDLLDDRKIFESEPSVDHDIAVIAVHGKFPGADDIEEFWENLINQNNSLQEFTLEQVNSFVDKELASDPHYVKVQGMYPDQETFDFHFFGITPREAELMDPQQRKFLELSYHAFELAGYRPDNYSGSIGVFAGMGNSRYQQLVSRFPEKVAQLGEFNVMLGLEKDYIATKVAFKLNLKGPALSIHTGCSTSLVAIVEAVKSLRLKHCDMAIAGGISIQGMPYSGHLYQEGGIFSSDGYCRPFDRHASGTVFTEGGGIVVLKRLSEAVNSGDNILAVIKGVGINNDGADKMSFTAPSVSGQCQAILNAQKDARIKAETIGFIEAHGTGTPVGDPIEVEALTKAFGKSTDLKDFCYLSSVKSNIGHLTSAAGVASFIKAVLTVQKGIIPGTAHFDSPNELLELSSTPFIVTKETTKFPVLHDLRRAGISSFGVGGTNAHIIIEQYVPDKPGVENGNVVNSPTLFKLSAKSILQVAELREKLIEQLSNTSKDNWKKIAYTLDTGRKRYRHRDFLVVNDESELHKKSLKVTPKSIHKANHGLVLLFSGQGSQYSGMSKNLYDNIKFFRECFDECNKLIEPHLGYDLKGFIHNNPGSQIDNTFYSQPALFVVEYCLAKTLLELGYTFQAVTGHSIGEYAAAVIAGVFELNDALQIVAMRAKLMQEMPPGRMLSVSLTKEYAKEFLEGLDIDVAAENAENSCVLSGSDSAIDQLKLKLNAASVAFVELKTSHAFHSRMMNEAVPYFEKFISSFTINQPKIPFYSTVTGKKESELLIHPGYWASQIRKTVLFKEAAFTLKADCPFSVFVEIGTRNILGQLLKKMFRESIDKNEMKVISLLGLKSDNEYLSFLNSIGELWVEGIDNRKHTLLYNPEDQKKHIAPLYPFAKSKCWLGPFNNNEPPKIHSGEIIMNDERLSHLKNTLSDLFEKSSGIPVNQYADDTSFMEMGMDSLFLTQISMQIKKEFKVNLSFRQLMEDYSSLNSLSDFLIDKVALNPRPLRTSPGEKTDDDQIKSPDEFPSPVPDEVNFPSPHPFPGTPPASPPGPGPVPAPEIPGHEVISPSAVEDNDLKNIILRQLDLMNQQISLLSSPKTTVKAVFPAVLPLKNESAPKRGADIKKSLDPFGAAPRISVEKTTGLSDQQWIEIHQFFKVYTDKTRLSKKFTQDNRRNHADPRVVTGFKPESKEICYPIVVKKSLNQKLWDLDDNEYIDMICGFGSNFFGNQNSRIKQQVIKQIEEGIELGPQHPLVSDVSNLICELTGNERAAFCNTGSEAVLGAMRLARTVTGREKIIVFSGSYHGINDEVILRSTSKGVVFPAAPGINSESVSNMIVLEYGTTESLKRIKELSHEVAAVLVEPVQSRRCNFHPVDFLKEVRKITEENQTCLIFDEIITGFRIHPAGAQGHFGIRADLCTYGKIVGGGMPIGVISGKSEYMDALDGGYWQYGDDSTPTVGVTYFAGTFVRHPLALAAAKEALTILKEGGVQLLNELNQKAQNFVDDLNRFLLMENVPLEMNNFGSLMKPKWTKEVQGAELLFAFLRFNGVHCYDGFPWFINLAHTAEELSKVLEAFKTAVRKMQSLGIFPHAPVKAVFDPSKAPVIGARIGRDDQGNPGWYIENPEKSGEYFLLEG